MSVRKIEELAVEILYSTHHSDGTYYLKVERYVFYPHYKEVCSTGEAFIRIDKDQADEIITSLKLIAVEREDKTGINYRGKAWLKQQKYRNKTNK